MRSPYLSFCMPTYNYGRYIETALESIRSQAQESGDVEVLVLDGGSTDETSAVVRKVAAEWPAVRYVRQESRGGIDADMARSVDLARGQFCWLLSADDALLAGAVARMTTAFREGNDIVLCNRLWCDGDLRPIARQSWLADEFVDRAADFSRPEELLAYLRSAQSLGALFSFMSCIGFQRDAWIRTQPVAAVPCYTHVGRLFAMALGGARLLHVAAPLILCRGGTDSFRAGGVASRLLLDLRGFRSLAHALFPKDDAAQSSFLAVMRREHPLRQWMRARVETPDLAQWNDVETNLKAYGFSWLERSIISMVGAPMSFLRAAIRPDSRR